MIGLLAVSGLRLGEALGLDRDDVDLDDGALHVCGKQGKQREVPVHDSATAALGRYAGCVTAAGRAEHGRVLPLHARRAAHCRGGPRHVPRADPQAGLEDAVSAYAPPARPPPLVGRPHVA